MYDMAAQLAQLKHLAPGPWQIHDVEVGGLRGDACKQGRAVLITPLGAAPPRDLTLAVGWIWLDVPRPRLSPDLTWLDGPMPSDAHGRLLAILSWSASAA